VAATPPELSKARGRRLVLVGNLISGTLLTLGIIGMLQTKLESTEDVTIITVHPVTAVVWFGLGAVGVAMCVEARRARLYLAATGTVLTLWGLLCLALDGTPSDVFARDPALVALLLVGGLLSLGVALAPPAPRLQRAHP
jgi:hypothetical protein